MKKFEDFNVLRNDVLIPFLSKYLGENIFSHSLSTLKR